MSQEHVLAFSERIKSTPALREELNALSGEELEQVAGGTVLTLAGGGGVPQCMSW
jgi:Nif11 domain